MIVPRDRLLFWFSVIVLPFSVLAALYQEGLILCLVLIAGILAVALLDMAMAFGKLDGLSLKLPELIRLSKDRPALIEVIVKNESLKSQRLRLGLALPSEIESTTEETLVVLPESAEQSRLEWPCLPLKRGQYRVRKAYLETSSRLGFWAVRAAVPVQCELRVYPNLISERKDLAALFLHRGTLGLHAQRQVGKGRDFEKLREYVAGDSYDEIHWKATARRGHPVTKVFQIERTQEVYVVLDASRLSARPAARLTAPGSGLELRKPELVLERFLTAALILGQAAEQQGDLFGLLTMTDKVDTFLRARNGKTHYSACRDAIYTLQPQNITPDFDEITSFIRTRLRRRALLIFLTSLDDPLLAESFVRNMKLLSGQHVVLVSMIKPPGAQPLFTDENVSGIDDLYGALGGHLQWHNLREVEKVLQRQGVRFSLLENERLASELVSQYVGVKQRQLL